ncbi:hypothetical protein [Ekhidna sp.]
MKKAILSIFITLLILTVQAQEIDISGDWTITQDTPRGKRSSDISIKQDGSKATVWSNEGEYVMTIDGQNVSWDRNITTPMGAMAASFKGKISNENRMSGTSSFSSGPMSGRSMNWSANRKKTEEQIEAEKVAKKAKKKKKGKKKKDNG